VRLQRDPATRAFTVLVEFPEGWARPSSGRYEAAEDIVVLEGGITINGVTYAAGSWAYFPEHFPRVISAAEPRMLALARFSGPARWVEGIAGAAAAEARTVDLDDARAQDDSPFGAAAALRRGKTDRSWLLPDAPGGTAPVDCELLELEGRVWAWIPAGGPLPAFHGACFCRTFPARPRRQP